MKVRQRLAAAVVAAATLGSMMVPTGAGAATYDVRYDVNQDGTVNILDSIVLNQYLAGLYYVSAPIQMDMNGNLIIDGADSECLVSYILDVNYTCTFVDIT